MRMEYGGIVIRMRRQKHCLVIVHMDSLSVELRPSAYDAAV
jgi:hypothetical protein